MTAALELIFENVCRKCDELEAGTGSADDEANRKPDSGSSKSPVDLTIEFLSKGNLEDLVQQRLAEKETKVLK